MTLFAIGLGYCAQRFVATRRLAATSLGTARDRERVAALAQAGFRTAFFDGVHGDASLRDVARNCELILSSTPPNERGDPGLAAFAAEFRASGRLRRIVYLSTIGVYGDHAGAWIDEDASLRPLTARAERRLRAEAAWMSFAGEIGARVFVLRLGGIYGPGRNPLAAVADGTARRILKPGQTFNRIHVDDVANAIEACFSTSDEGGAFNIVDDEPAPQGDPLTYAAELLGAPTPPEIAFEKMEMSEMARSFWMECKRVSNRRAKQRLGLTLAYPTYREGLRALCDAEEGRGRRS